MISPILVWKFAFASYGVCESSLKREDSTSRPSSIRHVDVMVRCPERTSRKPTLLFHEHFKKSMSQTCTLGICRSAKLWIILVTMPLYCKVKTRRSDRSVGWPVQRNALLTNSTFLEIRCRRYLVHQSVASYFPPSTRTNYRCVQFLRLLNFSHLRQPIRPAPWVSHW